MDNQGINMTLCAICRSTRNIGSASPMTAEHDLPRCEWSRKQA